MTDRALARTRARSAFWEDARGTAAVVYSGEAEFAFVRRNSTRNVLPTPSLALTSMASEGVEIREGDVLSRHLHA